MYSFSAANYSIQMTHQHRFIIHGLTTPDQANAILGAFTGQTAILDAQVTVDPPEVVLTVEHHPHLEDIQRLI